MYFFVRTKTHRPDFSTTMTEQEREVMMNHIGYLSQYAAKGVAIAFGPVLDPKGVYGVGIYETDSVEQMQEILNNDPGKDLLECEMFLMPQLVIGTR